ncbi:MAG TPA: hypothetical protein VMU04_03900 [Candidatus Acidoferrum sp.]|nr:hypothetical protein [Candidatus Acidoferrum sp.]
MKRSDPIARYLGAVPNRLQLAGGWIDQPFVSRHNPEPPGSMVVVQIEPNFRPMDRAGLANGTRVVALQLWRDGLPQDSRPKLVRQLYAAENKCKVEPSGSQDMIGLIYPGINRLDYDFQIEGGVFPAHIESLNDARTARWLEQVLHLLPVQPRPEGYNPLGKKNLVPEWIARLGQSGRDCFEAIWRRDVAALGASLNLTMKCWETLLPHVVRHPLLKVDLPGLLRVYQQRHPGAMYSGCGGGYLIVAAEEPVPGSFTVNVRLAPA